MTLEGKEKRGHALKRARERRLHHIAEKVRKSLANKSNEGRGTEVAREARG